MVDFAKLYAQALASVLNQDMEYFERVSRRNYSEKYFTPLHEVYKLPLDFIMINLMESNLASLTEEQLMLTAMRTADPNFDENEDKAVQELMNVMKEETAKKAKNASPVIVDPMAQPEPLGQGASSPVVKRTYSDDPPLGTRSGDDGLDDL